MVEIKINRTLLTCSEEAAKVLSISRATACKFFGKGGNVMPDIMSISEIVERAKQDLLPVSEYALRRWVRTGVIPARKIGKKYLVSYSKVVRYLSCEDGQDNAPIVPVAGNGIRRIDL